jgi:hypothetical protein
MGLFWALAEADGADDAPDEVLAVVLAGDEVSASLSVEVAVEGADVEARGAAGSGAIGAMDEILPICIFLLRRFDQASWFFG